MTVRIFEWGWNNETTRTAWWTRTGVCPRWPNLMKSWHFIFFRYFCSDSLCCLLKERRLGWGRMRVSRTMVEKAFRVNQCLRSEHTRAMVFFDTWTGSVQKKNKHSLPAPPLLLSLLPPACDFSCYLFCLGESRYAHHNVGGYGYLSYKRNNLRVESENIWATETIVWTRARATGMNGGEIATGRTMIIQTAEKKRHGEQSFEQRRKQQKKPLFERKRERQEIVIWLSPSRSAPGKLLFQGFGFTLATDLIINIPTLLPTWLLYMIRGSCSLYRSVLARL